ncbi:MAG: hypothetical protein COR54_02325 [Elusimicrobia bacterium CG22_combo_CG10-13_8_21_14_all_63_91]|nr:MAG: hypothetical protein COR54_02325 [Elusimicrobia bacterium CG22_combo_CG10-13_8_21_14_all_63_91]PJA14720.1 MAG: hypothetical protein COX66_11950 [Elusimicrobia bacterium CG_4_10_14_0_2_um_filter_63_34]
MKLRGEVVEIRRVGKVFKGILQIRLVPEDAAEISALRGVEKGDTIELEDVDLRAKTASYCEKEGFSG